MDTDIFEKLNSKKPFRSVEIPKELLEDILLIPAEQGLCPFGPIIKVERVLSRQQAIEMTAYEDEKYRNFYQSVGMDVINQPKNLTFKQCLVRKDFDLLAEIVATVYYSKIRKQNPEWSNLCQTVEIDWSMRDFYPGEGIHYEVFTKREIWIRDKDSEAEIREATNG